MTRWMSPRRSWMPVHFVIRDASGTTVSAAVDLSTRSGTAQKCCKNAGWFWTRNRSDPSQWGCDGTSWSDVHHAQSTRAGQTRSSPCCAWESMSREWRRARLWSKQKKKKLWKVEKRNHASRPVTPSIELSYQNSRYYLAHTWRRLWEFFVCVKIDSHRMFTLICFIYSIFVIISGEFLMSTLTSVEICTRLTFTISKSR